VKFTGISAIWKIKNDVYKNIILRNESYKKLLVALQQTELTTQRRCVLFGLNAVNSLENGIYKYDF
jgi:hypothetical protein